MNEYNSSFKNTYELVNTTTSNSNDQKRKLVEEPKVFKKPQTKPKLASSRSITKSNRDSNCSSSHLMIDEYSKEEKHRRVNFHSLDQYTRHKLLINYYRLTHPGSHDQVFKRDHSNYKSDLQVLLENHRFIWSEEELHSGQLTWGQRVAKKYYDRLFKEYCIVDLSLYKENKFGMRWRTEPEVIEGKGQFICGAKSCLEKQNLTSWEVLFGYMEHGKKQSALVKLRLCTGCSTKLNYHRQYKKAKKAQRKSKKIYKSRKMDDNEEQKQMVETKEEIISEDESSKINRNENDETYEELIEKIWRQPVKLERDDNDDNEKQLENELDDYLNEFFM